MDERRVYGFVRIKRRLPVAEVQPSRANQYHVRMCVKIGDLAFQPIWYAEIIMIEGCNIASTCKGEADVAASDNSKIMRITYETDSRIDITFDASCSVVRRQIVNDDKFKVTKGL